MAKLCHIFPPKKKILCRTFAHPIFLGCKWCEVSPSKIKKIKKIKKLKKLKKLAMSVFKKRQKEEP
jgi:hypothetical protein